MKLGSHTRTCLKANRCAQMTKTLHMTLIASHYDHNTNQVHILKSRKSQFGTLVVDNDPQHPVFLPYIHTISCSAMLPVFRLNLAFISGRETSIHQY